MSEYVSLASGDGFEYIISRQAAQHAEAIKSKLEAHERSSGTQSMHVVTRVNFPEVKGRVLEMVAQFLCAREASGGVYMSSFSPLTALDPTQNEDRQLVIELLLAANFLSC